MFRCDPSNSRVCWMEPVGQGSTQSPQNMHFASSMSNCVMTLCWKYLVPFAFAAFVATLLWIVAVARLPQLESASGIALTVLTAIVVAFFLRQTKANISAVGDRVDLSNW